MIQYYALRDINGHYLGTIEFTGSVEYILNLFENGAWGKDATTGASKNTNNAPATETEEDTTVDASTGASESDSSEETTTENTASVDSNNVSEDTDATTGASETGSVDAEDDTADASTGASENEN